MSNTKEEYWTTTTDQVSFKDLWSCYGRWGHIKQIELKEDEVVIKYRSLEAKRKMMIEWIKRDPTLRIAIDPSRALFASFPFTTKHTQKRPKRVVYPSHQAAQKAALAVGIAHLMTKGPVLWYKQEEIHFKQEEDVICLYSPLLDDFPDPD